MTAPELAAEMTAAGTPVPDLAAGAAAAAAAAAGRRLQTDFVDLPAFGRWHQTSGADLPGA